jgi:signal peptidase I
VRDPVFFWNCGDRVLVAKWPNQTPNRWDVVVFKYPKTPVENSVPMNYIKRLTGLPGETIAILEGDLYVANDPIDYSDQRQPTREEDRWDKSFMYINALNAQEAFRAGKFTILRKPPAEILAMMRLVYDNDKQAGDLVGVIPPRWQGDAGWKPNDEKKPTSFTSIGDGEHWLRYRHIWVDHGSQLPRPNANVEPKFINNMMGYNFIDTPRVMKFDEDKYWVGDLILEANVDVTSKQGELIFELSRGKERYQAVFNLATGECTLWRHRAVSQEKLNDAAPAILTTGRHSIRFANVDQRLVVWVDNKLIFRDGVDYVGDRGAGPDEVNDKQPASIGVRGGARVTVSGLKLFRDTYYTAPNSERIKAPGEADMTMYIQPGHYLCMGDNSTQSSDGREWGSVPERLMLGRAVMVYFPVWPFAPRFGPIR